MFNMSNPKLVAGQITVTSKNRCLVYFSSFGAVRVPHSGFVFFVSFFNVFFGFVLHV